MERGIRALTGEEEARTAIQRRGRAAGEENDMAAGHRAFQVRPEMTPPFLDAVIG